MIPAEVPPVPVYAGDTCVFPTYTFKTDGGEPLDLVAEGWTDWTSMWRHKTTATDEPITLSIDISQASSGVLSITASAAQTRLMDGAGVWDLQAERPNEVRTFLRGSTTYLLDVTRA